MCGICGFVGDIYSTDDLKEHIENSIYSLKHRGPDDQGCFVSQSVALGSSRLAIQDPEQGWQPMSCAGYTLVFNGEIYNALKLKENLLSKGYIFRTTSDTEILLYALIEFGEAILPEVDGMFALALWDSNTSTLLLARDKFGEKPLYYNLHDKTITFASEVKALFKFPHIDHQIHEETLIMFLKNSYLSSDVSGWKHIKKLLPGTFLKFHQGNGCCKKYYTPKQFPSSVPLTPENLLNLLSENIHKTLSSDRPIGGFLSGGIDSSTVAYFLHNKIPSAPFFSIRWDDNDYSEEKYIEVIADALHLNHNMITCDSIFLMEYFDTIVDLYDEPFADESMFPTYCLAKHAKKVVDVVLTGDGADELFHGYERYFYKGGFEDYLEIFAATSSEILGLICHPEFVQGKTFLPEKIIGAPIERERSWFDLHHYLPGDILTKVDRATMAVGLEARAPFLTTDIANFALRCSLEKLIAGPNQGKLILRQAMHHLLPRTILDRKKMGFGVPLNRWFRSCLKEWMQVRLMEGDLYHLGWISKAGVKKLIDLHLAEQGNYARPILNLLVLERWVKRWKLIPALVQNSYR